MNRENLVKALQATTVADDQKEAGAYLDQHGDVRSVRERTTTASSDGAEWQNMALLTTSRSASADADRESRIKDLMRRWKQAARRARRLNVDPWSTFHIEDLPVLRARRYRYSAIRKAWTEDMVEVRMLQEAFARGAMRECYRLKKLSSIARTNDWSHAQNYVAKKYIQEVDEDDVFEDVKLQMDAKLWAEEFNRHDPPKKIDIVQMCVLRMIDLPGEPLFHLEHFIEGDYVKYNSNSGFVSDLARKTPQAFSHFTFERSGHQMIVVDVQGVGDLYTDPQVHTVLGTDYGDGNLGTRGMALFFHSHVCNDICHSLCLTEFDLSDNERSLLQSGAAILNRNPSTQFSGASNPCSSIVPELFQEDAMECLRKRTETIRSRCSSTSASSPHGSRSSLDRSTTDLHDDDCTCDTCLDAVTAGITLDDDCDDESVHTEDEPKPARKVGFHTLSVTRRDRLDSLGGSIGTSSMGSSRLTRETEREEFWKSRKQSIPAGVFNVMELQKLAEEARLTPHASILGQIHLDLARYHELGRFLPEEDNDEKKAALEGCIDTDERTSASGDGKKDVKYDKESALYHLDVARRCGVLEAVLTVAQMVLGLPHELLKHVGDEENWNTDGLGGSEDREAFGFELMEHAAEMGDRASMLFVAEAYETGRRMGINAKPSYQKSIDWYQKAVGFSDDDIGEGTAKPRYEILAKMAEMYKEGGCGLDQDFERAYNLYTEAAEVAMEAMKGKLATKYYEEAEMCSC